MIENYTIWIGLPAFNEQEAIKKVLKTITDLKRKGIVKKINVILFNDGSKDDTVHNAKKFSDKLNISVIDKKKNHGLGFAIFALINFFQKKSKKDDKLVLMDCDNTHDPNQIIEMVKIGKNKKNFVIIASRYKKRSSVKNVPFFRGILSDIAYIVFNFFFQTKGIKDFTCGYRMYDKLAINGFLNTNKKKYEPSLGFEMQLEILLKLRKTDVKFFEIPMDLNYQKKPTKSKMKILKTILNYLNLIFLKS